MTSAPTNPPGLPPGYQQHRPPEEPKPPRRKRHWGRWLVTAIVAVVALLFGLGLGALAGTTKTVTVAGPTVTATSVLTYDAPVVTATLVQNVPVPGPVKTVHPVVTHVVTKVKTVETPGPTQTVRVTLPPPAPKVAFGGDGTYLVGVDIAPGTYRSGTPASGNCYWARLSGSDTINDIIDNNNFAGPSVLTVESSDKELVVTGCEAWTRV